MDDLIRRADAIELCRKWRDKAHEAKDQDGWWMADNLLRHTKEIPSADAVSEWIPCSERLPKDEGIFLVTMETYVFNEYSHPVGTSFYSPSFGWVNASPNKVLAWMPLPKSYEEVKENE